MITLSQARYRPANHTGRVRDKAIARVPGAWPPRLRRPTPVAAKLPSLITGPPTPRRKTPLYSHTRYDDDGNETYKVNGTSGLTWEYGYNSVDELTSAKEYAEDPRVYGTGGNPVLVEVDYSYDAFGEMIQRTDGSLVSRFCQDGWNANMPAATGNANMNVWAVLNGSNAWQERDLWGDTVDQGLGRIMEGTSNYGLYSLLDRQQSVRDVIDATGTVQADIIYDAWGNITNNPNSTYRGWYAWTGRQFDVETDLQYNRARWYDSETGRWLTQDPLGFDAGDSNLYRYAANRPKCLTDPTGLFAIAGGDLTIKTGRDTVAQLGDNEGVIIAFKRDDARTLLNKGLFKVKQWMQIEVEGEYEEIDLQTNEKHTYFRYLPKGRNLDPPPQPGEPKHTHLHLSATKFTPLLVVDHGNSEDAYSKGRYDFSDGAVRYSDFPTAAAGLFPQAAQRLLLWNGAPRRGKLINIRITQRFVTVVYLLGAGGAKALHTYQWTATVTDKLNAKPITGIRTTTDTSYPGYENPIDVVKGTVKRKDPTELPFCPNSPPPPPEP